MLFHNSIPLPKVVFGVAIWAIIARVISCDKEQKSKVIVSSDEKYRRILQKWTKSPRKFTSFCWRDVGNSTARNISPKMFQLLLQMYPDMLFNSLTQRVFSHFYPPGTLSSIPHTPAAPPRWPHGQRISRSRDTVPAGWCG